MRTETIDATNVAEQNSQRKTIAIITSSMAHTLRAEMLSHFSSQLVERGWDITLITNNRQDYFDYLIDDRIKRHSMDMSFNPKAERGANLAKFVEDHPEIEHYLFWEARMKTFYVDFDTIQEMGKKVFVAFWDSLNELGAFSTRRRDNIMRRAASCDGVISSFPLDRFIHNVTHIPYLYPYGEDDLSRVQLGTDSLLLLVAGSSVWTLPVVQKFARLVETDETFQGKHLRIVPIEKELDEEDVPLLQEIADQYPENISFEPLCEKPHKILDGNAGVIIVDNHQEHPKMLSIAVGKGLPTLMVKGYEDYDIVEIEKGFRICPAEEAALEKEFRSFFDEEANAQRSHEMLQAVSRKTKDLLLDCWENVLLGKPVQEFTFRSMEHVLSCTVSYLKHQKQHVLLWHEDVTEFDRDPLVKKARKRAEKIRERRWLSPTWIFRKIKGRIKRKLKQLKLKYHYWENNRRFNFTFIELDRVTQAKLRLLILKMFVEFQRVCEQQGWRYYLAGGTLLGAARHKGFIPWDDDLDVVMPRKDYDEFLKKAPALLGDQFQLDSPMYPYCFVRLAVKGPRTTAPLHRKGRNIFIDILPLDCATEDEKKRIKHEKRAMWLKEAMIDESRRIPKLYKRNFKRIVRIILLKMFCPYKWMIKLWTKNATKYQSDDAKYWVCLPGDYGYAGEMFPKETWENPDYLEFEGMTAPVMRDWDTYLSNHYGDYMQCPPLSQRGTRHRIYSINLERYEDMSVEQIAQELSDDYFASTGKRVSFLK